MKKSNVIELEGREAIRDPLTELLRRGARQLIQQAVELELQDLLTEHAERRLSDGRAGVILPINAGHPVKRVNYAPEVSHDKQGRYEKDNPAEALAGIPGRGVGPGRKNRYSQGDQRTRVA